MAKKTYDIKKIFNYDIAGYSKPNMQILKDHYTKIMKGKLPVQSRVVLIAPEKFLKNCYAKTDITKEELRHKIDLDNLKPRYALPYIDLRREKALGRGRVLACYKAGVVKIPVLVVGSSQEQIDEYVKKVATKKIAKKDK